MITETPQFAISDRQTYCITVVQAGILIYPLQEQLKYKRY